MKCAYCGIRISDLRKHRRENSRCNRYYFEKLKKVATEALTPDKPIQYKGTGVREGL